MRGLAVALLTEDAERLAVLQNRLESTQMGRTVCSHAGFPANTTDPILRQIQDVRAEVVVVDIDPRNPERAVNAIEMIKATTSDIAIFAVGEMNHPPTIVAAMRAGAGEYLERSANPEALLDAFTRFAASRNKIRSAAGKGRVFTFLNSKGGAGATTVAVNTAVALQEAHGSVVLVDFAPVGNAALHLNLRPNFSVRDALQNLHRLDVSLLQGLTTVGAGGLHLLAGPPQPGSVAPTAADLARLFDLLVSHYRYVLVDCSSRLDHTSRLLCDLSNAVLLLAQADVVSLWSAHRVHAFLEESGSRNRVHLLLNRHKKIHGFSDLDVEKATNCRVLWKIPNQFQLVSPAIDKGVPVALQENQEISRSFRGLAAMLAQASATAEGSLDLVFQHDKAGSKKTAAGRLLISPLRAGQ